MTAIINPHLAMLTGSCVSPSSAPDWLCALYQAQLSPLALVASLAK